MAEKCLLVIYIVFGWVTVMVEKYPLVIYIVFGWVTVNPEKCPLAIYIVFGWTVWMVVLQELPDLGLLYLQKCQKMSL